MTLCARDPGRRRVAAVAAALAAGLLAGCAHGRAADRADGAPRAFAWAVSRPGAGGAPLVLVGSVHAARPGDVALPPAVEEAFTAARVLVVEVDAERVPKEHVQQLVTQLGLYTPPDHLSDHLAPETRALLPAALGRVGLATENVEPFRPWFLSTMLGMLELERAGYAQDAGVDHVLLSRARGEKRIVELESIEEQLGALAGLPDASQDLLLREQLDEGPRTAAVTGEAVRAWREGDAAALERIVFDKVDDGRYAALYDTLYYARNRRMAAALAPLASAREPHLAVVGAGHLVGPRGLLAELTRAGLEIRQLPGAPPGAAPHPPARAPAAQPEPGGTAL